MKPGPSRSCDCGKCALCKRRPRAVAYYRRNAERIIQASAENRRRRKNRPRPAPVDQDAELDRKAAEWLAEHP